LIAAALCGPGGKVMALEPDPRHYAALTGNLALNGFDRVQALSAAASATSGTETLVGYEDDAANRGVSRISDPGSDLTNHGGCYEVPSLAIDTITAASPVVDLVKIDVEGAEDRVLQGMREGLAARRYRAILLELHPGLLRARGVDPASCLRLLSEYGYRGWTIDASPSAYRRAIDPATPVESILRPLEEWQGEAWPHLLWRC
jgi:FkbM family methyltransferase